MKRFLVLASFSGSLLQFRGALLSEIQAQGFEVHVAAPDLQSGDPLALELELKGYVVHKISLGRNSMNIVSDIKAFFSIFFLLRRVRPLFFLGYTIKPVIYGSMSAFLSGVPNRYSLITGLGYSFQNHNRQWLFLILKRFVCFLYKAALISNSAVFFQNQDDRAVFQDLGLLSPKTPSFLVNGSGVDLVHYRYVTAPVGQNFLMVARLLADKGVREYAAAARIVRARYPLATFSLAGWIDHGPNSILQSELDAWVSDGDIKYLGHLSDVRSALALCSVYVLPSYREGTPRSVLEAMSTGRPIITTDAPGCRETVNNGDNGFLVKVSDVDSLVSAMERFIQHPELISRMGDRSRRVAEDKFDVNIVNAQMLRGMGLND